MNKLEIKFTTEEKKKLRKAKIKLSTLENYTLNDIFSALDADERRKSEISSQFFKYVGGNSSIKSLGITLNDWAVRPNHYGVLKQ